MAPAGGRAGALQPLWGSRPPHFPAASARFSFLNKYPSRGFGFIGSTCLTSARRPRRRYTGLCSLCPQDSFCPGSSGGIGAEIDVSLVQRPSDVTFLNSRPKREARGTSDRGVGRCFRGSCVISPRVGLPGPRLREPRHPILSELSCLHPLLHTEKKPDVSLRLITPNRK